MNFDWDGVLCLFGIYIKWVYISVGEVVSFQIYMIGEIYVVVFGYMVLKYLIGDGLDGVVFDIVVDEVMFCFECNVQWMFGIWVEMLLVGLNVDVVVGCLFGFLIGVEIVGVCFYWLGQNVVIVGDQKLMVFYEWVFKV